MGERKLIYWFNRKENCQRVAKDSKKPPSLLQVNIRHKGKLR